MARIRKKTNAKLKPPVVCQPQLPPHPQGESTFFRLPQELRDKIYHIHFSSTRLTWGTRKISNVENIQIRPAPNALALLKTCRRAKDEIRDTWLSQMLFSFEDPKTMLDKLTLLPQETLSKLRHVRVVGDNLVLSYWHRDVRYRLAAVLRLLPGLCLDTLTVFGAPSEKLRYATLNGLIKESQGWKELRFISHDSKMLGYPLFPITARRSHLISPKYGRKPQPEYWQAMLSQRDGNSLNPPVVIYRSTVSDSPGSVMNPKTREVFEQKARPEARRRYSRHPDADLMITPERGKELLIIAKRGENADYVTPLSNNFKYDIRYDNQGKCWKQIRFECIDHIFSDCEDWVFSDEEDLREAEVDAYDDVDDFVWPPLHLKNKQHS